MNDNQVEATLPTKWKFEGPIAWDRAWDFMTAIDEAYGIAANLSEDGQDGPCTVSIAKDDANESLDEIAKKSGGRAEPRRA